MLRIETRTDTSSDVTYVLAGQGLILADREFVKFLACGEGSKVELVHCPAYVLSWIRCEGEERKPS
jgi:hypothetical protein